MKTINFDEVQVENIMPELSAQYNVSIDVLRLDLVHPVVSGNKWFKLHPYLAEARAQQKQRIITWGGAWSNHILATAFACREMDLSCVLIIRGETPPLLSPTLSDAVALGAELVFVSRAEYRNKEIPDALRSPENYFIPEGGMGEPGVRGAASISETFPPGSYSYLITAVGSGTTAAGLLRCLQPGQELVAIPVLKGLQGLENDILKFAGPVHGALSVFYDYHFGGYAKWTPELTTFMNDVFRRYKIPTDIIYTGKLFFAVRDLVRKNKFPAGSRILVVHSGGIQGNRSVDNGTLIF